jgi:hypothetical protein
MDSGIGGNADLPPVPESHYHWADHLCIGATVFWQPVLNNYERLNLEAIGWNHLPIWSDALYIYRAGSAGGTR